MNATTSTTNLTSADLTLTVLPLANPRYCLSWTFSENKHGFGASALYELLLLAGATVTQRGFVGGEEKAVGYVLDFELPALPTTPKPFFNSARAAVKAGQKLNGKLIRVNGETWRVERSNGYCLSCMLNGEYHANAYRGIDLRNQDAELI